MKSKLYLLPILFFALVKVSFAQGPPNQFNYQAVARDGSGNVMANHALGIQITIKDSVGNAVLYRETFTKTTNAFGLFTVSVGSGTVTSGVFANISWSTTTPWLRVELDLSGGTSYSTNMGASQLLSVPYALYAKSSAGDDWTTSGNNIYNNNSGNVGIGSTTPTLGKLQVAVTNTITAIYASSTSTTENGPNISSVTVSDSAIAIEGDATGHGYGVAGTSAAGVGTYGQATSGFGVLGQATTGVGVAGVSTSNNAVAGASTTGTGVYGTSGSTSLYGVFGNNTSTGDGVYGQSKWVGVEGFASGPGNVLLGIGSKEVAGVFASASGNGGATGVSYGMISEAGSDSTVINVGGYGFGTRAKAGSAGSWGFWGEAADLFQSIGVEGDADTGTTRVGVYGYARNTSGSYAGFFNGQIYAITASSGIKAFKIDHPSDPANKFLFHSSVESNDMMNIYNGNVTTDANGEALVTLPSYFEVLNKDFKYQLTTIGQFAQAIVKDEISNNTFIIKTDKPNVKVSWQVTGVRNDPVANRYRIVDEVEKTAGEKGKYLNPEVYGMPESAGIIVPQKRNANSAATQTSTGLIRQAGIQPAGKTNMLDVKNSVKHLK